MAATEQQTFSTHDLRSHAVEYKRDHDNKTKWAHGEVWKDGRNGHGAPVKAQIRWPQTNKDLGRHRSHMIRRGEITDGAEFIPDPNADLDMLARALQPDADEGVAYSFDASRSPSQGSQILSLAVAKAVERYENTVTDKLVQGEWEVLDQAGEVLPQPTGKKGVKGRKNQMGELEAEYEFV